MAVGFEPQKGQHVMSFSHSYFTRLNDSDLANAPLGDIPQRLYAMNVVIFLALVSMEMIEGFASAKLSGT